MRTFGLISPMAAGKGTVADYLVKKYNAKSYRFSALMDDILARLHIPNSRDNQIKMGASMREQYGDDVWAVMLKKDILEDNSEIAVIDGLRYLEDLTCLQELPNFTLIAIETNADARFNRLKKRNDRPGEADLDRATFDEQHHRPTEKNITEVMKSADEVIVNDGTIEELYKKIDEIVKNA